MSPNEFRALALALPDVVEASHMHHPDFRVGGKIFATLGPGEVWGMVQLPPEAQARYVVAEPTVFEPAKGAWGRAGSTIVKLERARKATISKALREAWEFVAAKSKRTGTTKRRRAT